MLDWLWIIPSVIVITGPDAVPIRCQLERGCARYVGQANIAYWPYQAIIEPDPDGGYRASVHLVGDTPAWENIGTTHPRDLQQIGTFYYVTDLEYDYWRLDAGFPMFCQGIMVSLGAWLFLMPVRLLRSLFIRPISRLGDVA